MKKLYFLIITLISLSGLSQKDYSRYYNSWRLGLNLGGAWQTADYRSCWGLAGGITLEKGFHENNTNFFSFAIRGRYLAANTYGMDYNRNYDVKSNDAYNGKYDPKVNFVDSVSVGKQYVYDNYKMTLGEGSLELQLTFNRLRERTHVLLNLWGGIGVTSYRTNSDLLDANGKKYDFSLVDSTGNKTKALNTYNGLIDKKYESYAYGSKSGNLVTFSPSAGIGFGYQFSPGFSMLWEYKVTFPQGTNADLLDGKLSANKDAIGGSNDYYHYTGLNLVFTLRGKKKTKTPKQETVYTNTVATTNTVVAPTTSLITTNTVVTNTPLPTGPKPIISFITPPVNEHVVNNQQYKISAQVLNIANASQIQFKFNGTSYSNFSFNSQNHILEFNATLNNGSNSIQIIATNKIGTDNKLTTVIYDLPKPIGTPPTVTVINPTGCPANSQINSYMFKANATQVFSKNNVIVKVNNVNSTNFSFNAATGQIDVPLNLVEGSNSIDIIVSNDFGSDSKNCFINYTMPKQIGKAPLVTYLNPVQPGYITSNQSYVVKASVLNVGGQNGISVYFNGIAIPFVYNVTTKEVMFTANLIGGSNSISITANNKIGEDTKVTNVILKEIKASGVPPSVSLINPLTEINASNSLQYNFKLLVLNVASKNDISFLFNGNSITNFVYNTTTKQVDFATNLIVGNNTVIVKGTNAFGVDSKTIQVNYTPPVIIKAPPVVIINYPMNSLATSSNPNFIFKASVTNVPGASGLVVKLNGNVVTNYVYDGINLTYPAVLIQGNNNFEVNATNNDGTDSKNAIVNYKVKVIPVLPVVNLINPASEVNTSNNLAYSFKLGVLNVNSKKDIEVLFNGVSQLNFTYDATTKEVDFQTNLITGNNILSVKGTNQFGFDVKLINVNYRKHVDIKLPPIITFVNPINNLGNTPNANYIFSANIANMPSTNGLLVKYNGMLITNYTYDGVNIEYPATLNLGANSLEISVTNNDGSDSKTASVNYIQKTVARPPVVNIIQPIGMPIVSLVPYNFQFKAFNVTQNEIEVYVNGVQITQYNFVNNVGSFNYNLIKGNNSISVKATNKDGVITKNESVVLQEKIRIITTPTETISTIPTETISTITTTITTTTTSTTTSTTSNEKTLVICHIPPGNNQNPQTITIPMSAWSAHLAHGDVMGECSAKKDSTRITPRSIKNVLNENNSNTEKPDTLNKQQPINAPRRPR